MRSAGPGASPIVRGQTPQQGRATVAAATQRYGPGPQAPIPSTPTTPAPTPGPATSSPQPSVPAPMPTMQIGMKEPTQSAVPGYGYGQAGNTPTSKPGITTSRSPYAPNSNSNESNGGAYRIR